MARSHLEIAPEFLAAVCESNKLANFADQFMMMGALEQQDLVSQLIVNQEKIAELAEEWQETDA